MGVSRLRALLAVLLCLGAATLPGCRQEPVEARPPVEAPLAGRRPGTPAAAPLTIAVLPERNIFEQRSRYLHLQGYLQEALGRPVSVKLLDDYQLLFDEILLHRVDGAFFSSMNGAIAQLRGGVDMLARPVALDGSSTYTAVLFAAKGNGVSRDPRTWRGRRAALVSEVTTSGHLYPLSLLRAAGLPGDLESHLGHLTYAGSHDAAILAVLAGEADFGACKSTILDDYLQRHPEAAGALTRLDASEPVPSSALGVRPDLDPALTEGLRGALLGMHLREDGQRALRHFGAQRFLATGLADYEPVFAMARRAGVDLATWSLHGSRPGRRVGPPRAGDGGAPPARRQAGRGGGNQ